LLRDSIGLRRGASGSRRRRKEEKPPLARLAPSSPGVVIDCIIKSVYFRGRCYRSPSRSISLSAWPGVCIAYLSPSLLFPSLPGSSRPGEPPPPKPFVSERERLKADTRGAKRQPLTDLRSRRRIRRCIARSDAVHRGVRVYVRTYVRTYARRIDRRGLSRSRPHPQKFAHENADGARRSRRPFRPAPSDSTPPENSAPPHAELFPSPAERRRNERKSCLGGSFPPFKFPAASPTRPPNFRGDSSTCRTARSVTRTDAIPSESSPFSRD